jgi:MtN3 and saliva related transmembrane protein
MANNLDSGLLIFTFVLGIVNSVVTAIREIPQLVKLIRTKSGEDISQISNIIIITYSIFWIAFGALIQDYILVATSVFIIASTVVIMVLKVIYREKTADQEERKVLRRELIALKIAIEKQKMENIQK